MDLSTVPHSYNKNFQRSSSLLLLSSSSSSLVLEVFLVLVVVLLLLDIKNAIIKTIYIAKKETF